MQIQKWSSRKKKIKCSCWPSLRTKGLGWYNVYRKVVKHQSSTVTYWIVFFFYITGMESKDTSSQPMKPKLMMPKGQQPHWDWWYPPSQAVKIPRRDSTSSDTSDVGSPTSPTTMTSQNFSYPPKGHKPGIFREFDFVHWTIMWLVTWQCAWQDSDFGG